jgi:type IV fimbrial biogenesis protein FimT
MELVVTLTVAGIIVAFAVPAFRESIARSKLTAQANDMIAAMNLARSEAIKGNRTVNFCRAAAEADTTCANSAGNWAFWIVRSANGVLRRGAVDSTLTVTSNLSGDTASFRSDGLARSGTADTLIGNSRISITTTRISANNTRCVLPGTGSRMSINTVTGACP